MDGSTRLDAATVSLRCLANSPAPPIVVAGWKAYLGLSQSARENIWDVLVAAVFDPANPGNRELVRSFAARHGASEADIVNATNSCDFLVGRASALNLGLSDLEHDLAALSGGDANSAMPLLQRYEGAKNDIRRQLQHSALTDHGKVLTGLRWRVDTMTATDRAGGLSTNVIYLTLLYQDGDKPDRVTVQLTPESLQQLKTFMQRFGG